MIKLGYAFICFENISDYGHKLSRHSMQRENIHLM